MMKNKSIHNSIRLIGLIIIAVTLGIFFLLNFEKTAGSWWSLLFILVAEAALCVGLEIIYSMNSQINKMFIGSGISVTLALYLITTIISSLIVNKLKFNVNVIIITEIIILALTAVIILLFISFSQHVNTTDQKIVNDRKLMQVCEKRIYNLLTDTKNKDFESELNSLYECIKFTDKIGNSSVDEKIVTLITKLEQSNSIGIADNEIHNTFNEIFTLLNQRKMEVAESKRGGF